jgi:hypothetical protein
MLKNAALPFVLCLASLTGCKGGPQVTVCLIDYANNSLECARPDQSTFTLPVDQANNYACMSPDDFERLLQWIKLSCRK